MDIFFSEKGNVKRKVLRLSGRGQQTFLAKGRAVSTVGFAAPRARSQLLNSDAAAQKRPWTICKKTSTSVSRLNCLWTMKCEFRMIFTSHKIIFFICFSTHLKNVKIILSSWAMQSRLQAGSGFWAGVCRPLI